MSSVSDFVAASQGPNVATFSWSAKAMCRERNVFIPSSSKRTKSEEEQQFIPTVEHLTALGVVPGTKENGHLHCLQRRWTRCMLSVNPEQELPSHDAHEGSQMREKKSLDRN